MSTIGLFKSSRPDGRADWRVVFDMVEDVAPDTTITFGDLFKELGTKDPSRVYRAVGRANRELWSTRNRSLASVKGVGYRILKATEMERLANSYRQQSRRKMTNAVAVIDATDLNQLSSSEREWHSRVQAGFHILAAAMDNHESRLKEQEDMLSRLNDRVKNLESRG